LGEAIKEKAGFCQPDGIPEEREYWHHRERYESGPAKIKSEKEVKDKYLGVSVG
jgi:hypothetical protein